MSMNSLEVMQIECFVYLRISFKTSNHNTAAKKACMTEYVTLLLQGILNSLVVRILNLELFCVLE